VFKDGGLTGRADAAPVPDLSEPKAEAVLQRMAPGRPASDPERHQATSAPLEQLRKLEARYRVLVEQLPAITFMAALDDSLNELYVSPQIEKVLGYTQKEWLEDPILWYTRLHPGDRDRWHVEFAHTCATGEPFCSQYRFLAKDGRTVWVHGEARTVRDEQGRPLFLHGIAFDITEQKQAEELLRRGRAALEEEVRQRTAELNHVVQTLHAEIAERKRVEAMLQEAKEAGERFAREGQVSVSWERLWQIEPVLFHAELIQMCADAIAETCGQTHRMPSGPLHDAAEVSRAGVPTVMMFVQSLHGISHNKIEDTKEEHLELCVTAFDKLAEKAMEWVRREA